MLLLTKVLAIVCTDTFSTNVHKIWERYSPLSKMVVQTSHPLKFFHMPGITRDSVNQRMGILMEKRTTNDQRGQYKNRKNGVRSGAGQDMDPDQDTGSIFTYSHITRHFEPTILHSCFRSSVPYDTMYNVQAGGRAS